MRGFELPLDYCIKQYVILSIVFDRMTRQFYFRYHGSLTTRMWYILKQVFCTPFYLISYILIYLTRPGSLFNGKTNAGESKGGSIVYLELYFMP